MPGVEISLLCRRLSLLSGRQYWQEVNLDIYSPATLADELQAIDLYKARVAAVLSARETMVNKMIEDLGKEDELDY
jgi:hypothetical protein